MQVLEYGEQYTVCMTSRQPLQIIGIIPIKQFFSFRITVGSRKIVVIGGNYGKPRPVSLRDGADFSNEHLMAQRV